MALQTSGPLKISDLAAQFGQSTMTPVSMGGFIREGAYGVRAAAGAPNVPSTQNNVHIGQFYGAFKVQRPTLGALGTLTGANTSTPVTFDIAALGGFSAATQPRTGTIAWSLTGNPAGVTINASTGVVTVAAGSTVINRSITATAVGHVGQRERLGGRRPPAVLRNPAGRPRHRHGAPRDAEARRVRRRCV
jgi:hypothetical protein